MQNIPPSHYVVLGLEPGMLKRRQSGEAASASASAHTAILRRAYRRALLRHHPDKQAEGSSTNGRQRTAGTTTNAPAYTVDQITTAWAVLSDPARRRAYDQELLLQQRNAAAVTDTSTAGTTSGTMTGMEVVDLDDLAYDEPAGQWYRSCRCGNDRGFLFGESDLEEEMEVQEAEEQQSSPAGGRGGNSAQSGELLVGCQDCSLWLCVHFAVMAEG